MQITYIYNIFAILRFARFLPNKKGIAPPGFAYSPGDLLLLKVSVCVLTTFKHSF